MGCIVSQGTRVPPRFTGRVQARCVTLAGMRGLLVFVHTHAHEVPSPNLPTWRMPLGTST